MKKALRYVEYLILLAIIGVSGYFVYQKTLDPCERQIRYSIGRFDTQFGITQEQFKFYIAESEKIWEEAAGRDIFIYDQEASFKIGLVYDERQIATNQKRKIESGLSAIEEIFRRADAELGAYKSAYEGRLSAYEKALAAYDARKAAYDREVAEWNGKGGAPKDVFESLEAERRYLNNEVQKLNAEGASLNGMTERLDALLGERNTKASEYNRAVEDYNERYEGGLEFNQAEYNERAINVYQFGSKQDLILAISHELGHALGMDHVDDPASVMYYLTGINAETSPTLSAEDLAELNRVCEI